MTVGDLPDDEWEREWNRLHEQALDDFKKGVPPLATYTSERGTMVVMRAVASDLDDQPVGIYLIGRTEYRKAGSWTFTMRT